MRRNGDGYLEVIARGHPFARKSGYVPQHRLVMELAIGRYIDPSIEHVHHIDRVRDNNALSNLALVNKTEHARIDSGWVKSESGTWFKTCGKCDRFLEVKTENFRRRNSGAGFRPYCRACENIYKRKRRVMRKR